MRPHAAIVTTACVVLFLGAAAGPAAGQSASDTAFDLRDVYGDGTTNHTTVCRSQVWGTCWCHGTMSAMESVLVAGGAWSFDGSPWSAATDVDLAEYHLDKFNGFNRKGQPGDEEGGSGYHAQGEPWPGTNTDIPLPERDHLHGGGMPAHQGGDYKVVASYLSRVGAVNEVAGVTPVTSYSAGKDQFGYSLDGSEVAGRPGGIPLEHAAYTHFAPTDIEWLSLTGTVEQKRRRVKQSVVENGAVATAILWTNFSYSTDDMIYTGSADVNHSVTIIGWDDTRQVIRSGTAYTGAWLCHNSWGSTWNGDGSFWVAYDDVHAARHPTMGAVAFRGVGPVRYDRVHSHSLHGWQFDTAADPTIRAAANRFEADAFEKLTAVSFYTVEPNATYTVGVHLAGLDAPAVATVTGMAEHPGYHRVSLEDAVEIEPGQVFELSVHLEADGQPSPQAFDASNQMTAALGGRPELPPYDIHSAAAPNESFYFDGSQWIDFQDYDCYANLGIWTDGGSLTYAADRDWNFAIEGAAVADPTALWAGPPGGSAGWADANQWAYDQPAAGCKVLLRNGGTAVVDCPDAAAGAMRVGPGMLAIEAGRELAAAELRVGADGLLTAAPGACIRLAGDFANGSTGAAAFDLSAATLCVDGPGPRSVEAAGADLGADANAWIDNFAVGCLAVGDGVWLELVDAFDNAAGAAGEALYADELLLGDGAWVERNGLAVYFRNGGPARELHEGDFDLSGTVDRDDLLILQAAFGTDDGAGWADGDTDGDGDVDYADYLFGKRAYGWISPELEALPEPASLLLIAAASVPVLIRRRRGRGD